VSCREEARGEEGTKAGLGFLQIGSQSPSLPTSKEVRKSAKNPPAGLGEFKLLNDFSVF